MELDDETREQLGYATLTWEIGVTLFEEIRRQRHGHQRRLSLCW